MIQYNGAKFHPAFMVQLRGSVMPFACLVALPCALFAAGLKLLLQQFDENPAWDLMGIDHTSHQVMSAAFSGMNFLIGFLVVFRAQQAYSRFWEGCTAVCTMQGQWFETASALVAFCKMSVAKQRDIILFQHTLVRLMSLLNATVLMELSLGNREGNQLPSTQRAFELELIDAEGIDSQSLLSINSTSHKAHLLFTWIQQLIVESDHKNVFSVSAPILSRAFQELGKGMVSYCQAAKIANVPLPFPYVQATEMLLVSHWLLIPFLMCIWVTSPIWTGLLTFVQVAFFWSLNSIATELENPFGEDTNDLPAQSMQKEFNQHLLLLLRPSTGITAHLSTKATNLELDAAFNNGAGLGRRGVSPRHVRRSSLEGSTKSLASLQECMDSLEAQMECCISDGFSETGVETQKPALSVSTKDTEAPVPDRQERRRSQEWSVSFDSRSPRETRQCSKEQSMHWDAARCGYASPRRSPRAGHGTPPSPRESRHLGPAMPISDLAFSQSAGHLKELASSHYTGVAKEPAGKQLLQEKCTEQLPSNAMRFMASDLSCLPEILAIAGDLRDQLQACRQALPPDLIIEPLACLPELVDLLREGRDRGHASRSPAPAMPSTPTFGPFSPEAEIMRRKADHRGKDRAMELDCLSMRSCSVPASRWSARSHRQAP